MSKKTLLTTPEMLRHKLREQGSERAISSETTQHRKIRSFEAKKGQEHLGKNHPSSPSNSGSSTVNRKRRLKKHLAATFYREQRAARKGAGLGMVAPADQETGPMFPCRYHYEIAVAPTDFRIPLFAFSLSMKCCSIAC